MKITLARSSGFCFGVKRAIDIAFKTAATEPDVYILGDIVHNEEVIKDLERTGIKKIRKLRKAGNNHALLIRAHGAAKKLLENARQRGYKIIDATCPMVKEIHKIAMESEDNGYRVIVIGDKKHDEVHGIIGQLKKKAIVIQEPKDITRDILRIRKAAVVVQSTQNIDNVLGILGRLKKGIGDLKFHNTICRPTRIKQEEIKKMPLEHDTMVIIGSKTSANTKRLYEISRRINSRTHWIQNKHDLKKEWFKSAESVGVTAGASTPDRIIDEVVQYLRQIKR